MNCNAWQTGGVHVRPKAIIVASAHWETIHAHKVSLATQPETIYDFSGFPNALYDMAYPASGALEVARRAERLLENAGLNVATSPDRGLDHGAWVPLSLMYPDADIPVTQISILRGGNPAEHEKLGRVLAPLCDEGILIIGSGSLTHNLGEFRGQSIDAPVPDWVSEFPPVSDYLSGLFFDPSMS